MILLRECRSCPPGWMPSPKQQVKLHHTKERQRGIANFSSLLYISDTCSRHPAYFAGYFLFFVQKVVVSTNADEPFSQSSLTSSITLAKCVDRMKDPDAAG